MCLKHYNLCAKLWSQNHNSTEQTSWWTTTWGVHNGVSLNCAQHIHKTKHYWKQGKSEGFESCDRPIVRKRPIWVKIGDVLSRVTFKFDGWPWKTIGHLSFAVSSFVQHFIAIGEFKLELLSGNAQFGSNSTNFRAKWPWNLTYDFEQGKSEGFDSCDRPSNLTQIGFKSSIFQPVWSWNLMDDPKKQ